MCQEEPDLLIMQPARALEFNTTYILSDRNLREDSGDVNAGMASPSPAFAALRDKDTSKFQALGVDEKRAKIYDDWLFPEIERKSAFQRDETLQLAFYFHTTSREESLGRYEYIRDKTLKNTRLDLTRSRSMPFLRIHAKQRIRILT